MRGSEELADFISLVLQDLSLAMRLRSDVSSSYATIDANKENISMTQPTSTMEQTGLDSSGEPIVSSGSGCDSSENSIIKPPALMNSEHL